MNNTEDNNRHREIIDQNIANLDGFKEDKEKKIKEEIDLENGSLDTAS